MIASFFQSLETHRVAYLLISGQATVLYGAATFSEDIDLWVEPSSGNIERFQAALSAVGARYYKLTPPLEAPYFEAGHGSVALQAGRRKGADQSAIRACKIKDVGKIDKPLNEEVCFWAELDCSEFKNRASRI
jgi:hypothetical protein